MDYYEILAASKEALKRREQAKNEVLVKNVKGPKVQYNYTKHSYMECLYQELNDKSSKLYDFFTMLEIEYRKEMESIIEELSNKIDILELKEKSITPSLDKLIDLLKNKNIELNYYIDSSKNGYTSISICNNNKIDIDNITDKIVFDRIKTCIKNNKSRESILKENIQKIKSEVLDNEKKLRFNIFKRNELKNQIESQKRILDNDISNLEKIKKENNDYTIFLQMTNEERILFKESIIELQKLSNLQKGKYLISKQRNEKKHLMQYGVDDNVMLNLMERLYKENVITDKKLESMFLLLDKVEIKGRRGEYNFSSIWAKSGIKNIAKWFVENIYEMDDDFVNRNYYINDDVVTKKLVK